MIPRRQINPILYRNPANQFEITVKSTESFLYSFYIIFLFTLKKAKFGVVAFSCWFEILSALCIDLAYVSIVGTFDFVSQTHGFAANAIISGALVYLVKSECDSIFVDTIETYRNKFRDFGLYLPPNKPLI